MQERANRYPSRPLPRGKDRYLTASMSLKVHASFEPNVWREIRQIIAVFILKVGATGFESSRTQIHALARSV